MQNLPTEDSSYVFYDAKTGQRKCAVLPSYSVPDLDTGKIEIAAASISIYAPEDGSLLYAGSPEAPYSLMTFGDFAERYCKTDVIAFLPRNHDKTVERLEKRVFDKREPAAIASR